MATLERLRLGDTLVVSSVSVLSEGFDEPLVSCVLLLRPTESRGLYIQQVSALAFSRLLVITWLSPLGRTGPSL